MGRVRHLTIEIYREMLRITRDLDEAKNITIDGFDRVQYGIGLHGTGLYFVVHC